MNVKPNGVVVEKSALNSKKFIAYLVAQVIWALIFAGTIYVMASCGSETQEGALLASTSGFDKAAMGTVLLAEILCLGFVQVVYIGGQAAVDAFVRMASVIVTGKKGAVSGGSGNRAPAMTDDDDTP